jgi:anaerobic magnesium-protoporphyrin IX monomethyl ester cyclase
MAQFLLLRTTSGISLFRARKAQRRPQPPFSPPLSLLYVASALENEGHRLHLIDVTCEQEPEATIQRLLPSQDAVIMSVYPGNYTSSSDLARLIRTSRPDVPIIIHGQQCTVHSAHALRDITSADICIAGEVEGVITEVVEALEGHRQLSDIPGVSYRDNNQIQTGEKPKEIQDIDVVSFPARHLVKEYDYGMINGIHLCKPKFTAMLTSRGCPFHCRFCAARLIHGSYCERSPENVLEELQEIQGDYNSVMINDDNFLADTRRTHAILDGLIQEGAKLDLFISGARVDSADRELYRKMAQAGVKFISFGIESGDQYILDYYQKRITIPQIRKAVELAQEMNIITWGNFIFGAPVETKEHLQKTLDFSLSLPLDMAFYRPLSYQQGAALWDEAVTNDLIDEETSFCYAGSGRTATHFTDEELAQYCLTAYKRFYLRPSYLLKEVARSLKRGDFTILRSLRSML